MNVQMTHSWMSHILTHEWLVSFTTHEWVVYVVRLMNDSYSDSWMCKWLIHDSEYDLCVMRVWGTDDMSHSCVCDVCMDVWLSHVCMTQSCVYDWFTCDMTHVRVTWRIHVCVWLIHVWYDSWPHSFMCEGLITYFGVCHMTGMSEWDQSFDLWVVYMCSISYIYMFHLIYIRATFIYRNEWMGPLIRSLGCIYMFHLIYTHVPPHINSCYFHI